MIKFYPPQADNDNHNTLINNIIFNSDHDCIQCGKTNPITENKCIKCGYRNPEVYAILGKLGDIDTKLKIVRANYKKELLKSSEINPVIQLLMRHYLDISARYFEYLINNYEEVLIELDHIMLRLM